MGGTQSMIGKSHHLNVTGPGDYNQTGMGDKFTDSMNKNKPSYTFGKKQTNFAVISGKHHQDTIGQDSPGVGAYSPQKRDLKLLKNGPTNQIISRTKRFYENTGHYNLKKNLPHSYIQDFHVEQDRGKYGPKIMEGKTRFKTDNPLYQDIHSPGPGVYNLQNHASKQDTSSKPSLIENESKK